MRHSSCFQRTFRFTTLESNVVVQLVSHVRLCDTTDWNLLGSSVHGILQARILEWVAVSLFQGIFLTQGSNLHLLCLLPWQVDSLPLCHLRNLFCYIFDTISFSLCVYFQWNARVLVIGRERNGKQLMKELHIYSVHENWLLRHDSGLKLQPQICVLLV